MILIDGYYGNKNTGDDLFVLTLFSILGKNIKFLTSEKIEGVPSEFFLLKNRFIGYQKILFVFLLLRHRKFLTGGGSVFEEKQKWSSFRGLALIINKVIPIKMYSIGVSLSANRDQLDNVLKEIKAYRKIYVRDLSSHDFSVKMSLSNVYHGVDLAYFNKLNNLTIDNNILTIIHCPYESVRKLDLNNERRRDENLVNYLINLIKNENFKEIQLLEFNGHRTDGDFEKVEYIKEALSFMNLNINIIRYSADPNEMIKVISRSKFVISTRLHGAILSHIINIPFSLVEYHVKCTDWLDTIYYPENYRIGDADISAEKFNMIYSEIQTFGFEENFKKQRNKILKNGEKIKKEFTSIINNSSSI